MPESTTYTDPRKFLPVIVESNVLAGTEGHTSNVEEGEFSFWEPYYTYLSPRPGSRYQQYFFTGRNLRAETLYRATIGLEPMTANEVAEDYDVPVEAVLEAIQYCHHNTVLLQKEREKDWNESQSLGLDEAPPQSSSARVGP